MASGDSEAFATVFFVDSLSLGVVPALFTGGGKGPWDGAILFIIRQL